MITGLGLDIAIGRATGAKMTMVWVKHRRDSDSDSDNCRGSGPRVRPRRRAAHKFLVSNTVRQVASLRRPRRAIRRLRLAPLQALDADRPRPRWLSPPTAASYSRPRLATLRSSSGQKRRRRHAATLSPWRSRVCESASLQGRGD